MVMDVYRDYSEKVMVERIACERWLVASNMGTRRWTRRGRHAQEETKRKIETSYLGVEIEAMVGRGESVEGGEPQMAGWR